MEVSFHPFVSFIKKDDACKQITKIVQRVIKDSAYQQDKTSEWINKICDHCLSALQKLSGNFKYIVNCIVAEKSSLDVQNACHYTPFDANCLITWENQSLSVIINFFALAL